MSLLQALSKIMETLLLSRHCYKTGNILPLPPCNGLSPTGGLESNIIALTQMGLFINNIRLIMSGLRTADEGWGE